MVKWDVSVYHTPAYPVTDAARYLHIPVITLQSWLKGRSYPTKRGQQAFAPLIQRPDPQSPQLSFTNLIEAHVLRIIREHHQVKLDKVRTALDYLAQQFNTEHPLVLKRFQTDGVDLFVEEVDHLVNISRAGQLTMREALKNLLTRIEWDADDIATRFFPILQPMTVPETDKVLFLDPRIRFGRPMIAGKGVPTAIVAELYNAGDSIEAIADEYDCTPDQIKAAIQFEAEVYAA
jgi:uncharacterized protein (DUF433 family)